MLKRGVRHILIENVKQNFSARSVVLKGLFFCMLGNFS